MDTEEKERFDMSGVMRDSPIPNRMWHLAWPMILANISIPLLGLVDTAVMGYMESPDYLAAVSFGAVAFSFIYWAFGFLRMSTTGFVAQMYGAKDFLSIGAYVSRSIVLLILIVAVVLVIYPVINWLAFVLLEADGGVELMASSYMDVRIISAPATLANYLIVGILVAFQNTRAVMWLLLLSNVLNIILDLLFVVVFSWGVEGVAMATVLAEYAAFLLGVGIVVALFRKQNVILTTRGIVDWQEMKLMVNANGNIMVRTLCLMAVFSFFTLQGAKYGSVVMAANAVLMNFQALMAYVLDGFAHSVEALVGDAAGSKSRRRFLSVVKSGFLFAFIFSLAFVVLYAVFAEVLVGLLTDLEVVVVAVGVYLFWLVLSPIISSWAFIFDGLFIGLKLTAEMRNAMLFSLVVFFVAWYLLLPYGNHGLWGSLMIFMVVRSLSMGYLALRLYKENNIYGR